MSPGAWPDRRRWGRALVVVRLVAVKRAMVAARPVVTWTVAFLPLAVAMIALQPTPVAAQSYRGWIGSSMQVVELRPVGLDSVPRADVTFDDEGSALYQGYPVACEGPDLCVGTLPLSKERAISATQDASLTFWGLGVEGLSVMTLFRIRAHIGDDLVWPRYDDEFDLMLGYAQFVRGPLRVRAGRQDIRSGLGMSGFDGVSAAWDRRGIRGEAYAGRSLARGLREPANEAFRGLDDFFVDYGAYLFGGAATVRRSVLTLTARYHRELLSDRSGLDGERAALDFTLIVPRVRVSGSIDYDFSFEQVGKSHLTVSAPLREGFWMVELTGRRYVPYFQLSTIWGFFEPVSYSEVIGRVAWSGRGGLGAWLSGGWRKYGETETPIVVSALEDTGWRADAGARWQATPRVALDARYQLEWGSGAFLNSADIGARFSVTDRLTTSLTLSSFQQIEEYRLGDGRAVGGGLMADYMLTDRIAISAGGSMTRHRDGGTVFTSPWNQTRGWVRFRWDVGRDPGLANSRGQR